MRYLISLSKIVSLACGAWLMLAASTRAEEFPDVEKLPSVAELPDALLMLDGTRVTTAEQWNARRKPELKALFQHYMYGYMPAAPQITAKLSSSHADGLGGKATMKQVTIAFGPPACPRINLLLCVPKRPAGKPAPAVFLGLNFTGNHSVLDDRRIALPTAWMREGPGVEKHRAAEAGRGTAASRWEIEHTIDRGYAVATFYYGDVLPDKPDLEDGVHPHFRKPGQTGQAPTDWGAIAAWAWGLQRAVDYLMTDPDVDGRRIIVLGHSRNGKAALLAGAFDDRIAAVIAHQAGCGGSGPSRRKNPKAESVTVINQHFPHWFNAVFKQFNGREDRLPFDQNCLAALCAPRPVLFTAGEKDQWANPAGQLDVLRAADRVYRLFGLEGIPQDVTPSTGKLLGTYLCYYTCDSIHTVNQAYWDVFLEFAEKSLARKPDRGR